MNNTMKAKLGGGDLRSIGEANQIVKEINNQNEFDILFQYLHENDRLIVMRAADALEKITLVHPEYLQSHKNEIIEFSTQAENIEYKWHLALLLSRLLLSQEEQNTVFEILGKWATNPKESKIVRVNAIQSLSELSNQNEMFKDSFLSIIRSVKSENIPSINARLRKLKICSD